MNLVNILSNTVISLIQSQSINEDCEMCVSVCLRSWDATSAELHYEKI